MCYDVRVALIDMTTEAQHLVDPGIVKTNYEILYVKASEIAEHREAIIRVDNYELKTLQTFLDEIRNDHLLELEIYLKTTKQHFNRVKNYGKLQIRTLTYFYKILAKLRAVNSEFRKHPEWFTPTVSTALQSAVDKVWDIYDGYCLKNVSDEVKLEKLNEAILSVPELQKQIKKFKSYLPENWTTTDRVVGTIDISSSGAGDEDQAGI